jgi:nucleoside-diphosphate-sugar epimerase
MRVLVAGCGWLGREVARRLAARGDTVIAIVRTEASAGRLRREGIDALAIDLARREEAGAVPGSFDAVVAMQSADGHDEAAYRKAYVDATRGLLESGCARHAPFLYIGSTGVFGQRDGGWVAETTVPEPAEATARVLVEAEGLVLGATRFAAMPMVLRCSGLYGPGRTGTIDRVRAGVLALGDGDRAWMNFCHRDDAAVVVLAAIDRGRSGAVYHASDALPVERREVVTWIAGRLGIDPARRAEGTADGGRRGANRRVSGEATRAELGVRLAFPTFRDGLAPFLP